jgi:hypothetical protein
VVSLSLQSCHFSLLRVAQAFGLFKEVAFLIRKPSQKQLVKLPRVWRRRVDSPLPNLDVEMLDLQRAVLLHCKVDVGDPLGPPSTAPRLGFTVEWSASKFRPASPASPASQELDLYLLVKQPDTLSFFLSLEPLQRCI